MSRSTLLIFVVLGAALAGFAFSSAAGRLRDEPPATKASVAASPQTTNLDWRETYGARGQRLVFEVKRLEVLGNGWRAQLELTNNTSVAYEVGDPRATLHRSFGLMLFATGDNADFERLNREGTLPEIRQATKYEPSLPVILEPGHSWEGTISAPGALVAGSWVRVVFGLLVAVGRSPTALDDQIVWISDHVHRLRR